MTMPNPREVSFHVFRYAPETDARPYVAVYGVPVEPGMTVLDGLHYIKENLDPRLAWRSSCRMGVCGSCGMLLNGAPALACHTQILEIAGSKLALAPLPNFEVTPFVRSGHEERPGEPATEEIQSTSDLVRYLQFSFCIKCGCCMSACPTLATDERYLGPMPLTQALRYSSDTRDAAEAERARVAGSRHGVFRCHYAGECSRVCPKGVDPAKAIQLLKRSLVAGYLGLAGRR
jgi:succinate dehydrogenase / fumarate reductase iron-sulfur subunit